jgi:hypothetical protein
VFHLVRLALQSFGKEISRLTALCISLEQEEYFPEIKEFTERTASKFVDSFCPSFIMLNN